MFLIPCTVLVNWKCDWGFSVQELILSDLRHLLQKVADRRKKENRVEGGLIMVCRMSCVFSCFMRIYLISYLVPVLNGSDLSGRMVHKE